MSETTLLLQEAVYQHEDLGDPDFHDNPFNFCFNPLLSPKSAEIGYFAASTHQPQPSIDTNTSLEILDGSGPTPVATDSLPDFPKRESTNWDEATILDIGEESNPTFKQVGELELDLDKETTDEDLFRFLQGELLLPSNTLDTLPEVHPDFRSFNLQINPVKLDLEEPSKKSEALFLSNNQAILGQDIYIQGFNSDYPSFKSEVADAEDYPKDNGDLLVQSIALNSTDISNRQLSSVSNPAGEITVNRAQKSTTSKEASTTNLTRKSPNQAHSSPRKNFSIGKVKNCHKSCSDPKRCRIDYSKINLGKLLVEANSLRNVAFVAPERPIEDLIKHKLIRLKSNEDARVTQIKRTRYLRGDLSELASIDSQVQYQKNPCFGLDKPYEPEFIRFEVDPVTGFPYNETRCGLCPYCPDMKFRNFKTSTYSQHLALWHGVHTDNYLTPNPSHYGIYKLSKDKNIEKRKTIAHLANKNGVVCPVCHDVIETECSKTTLDKPLSGYLRHFRDQHRKSNFKWDPYLYFTRYQSEVEVADYYDQRDMLPDGNAGRW